jgi:hypothetical protein
VASLLALLSEMSALQQRRVTEVAPLVFVIEVVIPVLLAPVVVGEVWTGSLLGAAGVLAGLAAVVAGAVVLTSSSTVAAFVEPVTARPA